LQVRRAGTAVEPQREVVGREDLAERHGRRVLRVDDDMAVIHPEVAQLGAYVAAERVVADSGDDRRPPAEPRRRNGDVGGRTAEILAKRLDVFETDADLLGVDIDPTAPEGQ